MLGSRRQLAARGMDHRHRILDGDRSAGPLACISCSVRPRQGRMIASLPTSRCERLSLVAICTARSSLAIAGKHCSGSGMATARLPPRQISTFDLPAMIACMAATASWPCAAGGLKPKVASMRASISAPGFSVMPTVRSPCTLEWPRSGQMPAPGLPILPRMQQQIGDLLDVAGARRVLGDAHAVGDDRRVGLRIGARHRLKCGAVKPACGFDIVPGRRVEIGDKAFEAVRMFGDEVVVENRRVAAWHPVEREQRLHDALQRRGVAADLHLIIGGGDVRVSRRSTFRSGFADRRNVRARARATD